MTFPIKAIIIVSCFVFSFLVGRFLNSSPKSDVDSRELQATQNISSQTPRFASRLDSNAQKSRYHLESDSLSIAKIIEMNPFDNALDSLIEQLQAYLTEDEAAAVAWLDQLTEVLVSREKYQQALDFLDHFNTRKSVPGLERKIAQQWLQHDFDDVLNQFKNRSQDRFFVNPHQVGLFASLVQNEELEHKDQFFSWVKELQANPKHDDLYGAAVGQLINSFSAETKDDVIKFVEENASETRVSGEIVANAHILAPGFNEEGLEWVSSLGMKDEDMKAAAFSSILYEMTTDDALLTADILSSEHFLDTYYNSSGKNNRTVEGDWTPEAKKFYDKVLADYLISFANQDPHIVLNSLDAFFDENMKNQYKTLAQKIIDSPYHVSNEECSGCDNTDHKH